ncbi:rCG37911, partial [Rattus norvegicus]
MYSLALQPLPCCLLCMLGRMQTPDGHKFTPLDHGDIPTHRLM